MTIFNKIKEKIESKKEDIVKYQVRKTVKKTIDKKLNLNGKYDNTIELFSDNVVDKIGTDNIIKAKKIIDIIKK